jgi:hypothetical protein
MGNTYSLELQVECSHPTKNTIVVMVLFKVDPNGKTTSHFLKELGIGTGDIKKMAINKTKQITFDHPKALQNLIDHFFYVNYNASSLFGNSCDGASPDIEYFLITETIKITQ